MPIRFQADADFNQIIVLAVVRRFPEIDFRSGLRPRLASLGSRTRKCSRSPLAMAAFS